MKWFNGGADTPAYVRPGGAAQGGDQGGLVARARAAVAAGADPAQVKARLAKLGYTGAF